MGKPKYIATPEKMWELFLSYRSEVKDNPITVTDWVGAKAIRVERPKERPLTLEGFSAWCFNHNVTSNIHDYFGNKNEAYKEYSDICSRIKEVIRADQIEGGMAGIYNPSITQRLNSLTEKTELSGAGGAPVQLVFSSAPGCEPIKDEEENINDTGI